MNLRKALRGPLAFMREPRPVTGVSVPRNSLMHIPPAPPKPLTQQETLLKIFDEARGKAPHIYGYMTAGAARDLAKNMVEDEKATVEQLVAHYGYLSANENLCMAAKAALPFATDKASFHKWVELFYKSIGDD